MRAPTVRLAAVDFRIDDKTMASDCLPLHAKGFDIDVLPDGREALIALKSHAYHGIIAGMDIPEMDTVRFFSLVRDKIPQSLRIALLRPDERNRVIDVFGLVHQFIDAPCDPKTTVEGLRRTCLRYGMLTDLNLRRIVADMTVIPSYPSLYFALLDELAHPHDDLSRIGAVVSQDVGLTARIMRLINAPFFGLVRHINDPAEAVAYLGIETVKGLVLSTHVFSRYEQALLPGFSVERVWAQSLQVALCARELATDAGLPKETREMAFLAGILHDIGLIMTAANHPDDYRSISRLTKSEGMTTFEAERSVMGVSHEQVGAMILGSWGLPPDVVDAVLYHHVPSAAPDEFRDNPILRLVHVADAIVDSGAKTRGEASDFDQPFLASMGASADTDRWRTVCHRVLSRR
ncbi:MAG: HDOD domain-containing protein [Nitrospinae bacterium]|nr:HDOD domain-containing protein [Nitrospinota bacterium]